MINNVHLIPATIRTDRQMNSAHEEIHGRITSDEFWQIWQSSDKGKFYDLYSRINGPEDLIPLLQSVPKANVELKIDRPSNRSKILVIVPTSDEKSERSSDISHLFAPYPVVFAVSTGPYFNYPHSCNIAISEAVKYDPEWIVLCNDDMIAIDPVEVLVESLDTLQRGVYTATNPGRIGYHGEVCLVTKPSSFGIVFELIEFFFSKNFLGIWALTNRNIRRKQVRIDIVRSSFTRIKSKFSRIRDVEFMNFSDFAIFSASLAKEFRFDELFLSDYDDYDLSLRLYEAGIPVRKLPFKIGSVGGYSMSGKNGTRRFLRDQISRYYLTFKLLDKGMLRQRP